MPSWDSSLLWGPEFLIHRRAFSHWVQLLCRFHPFSISSFKIQLSKELHHWKDQPPLPLGCSESTIKKIKRKLGSKFSICCLQNFSEAEHGVLEVNSLLLDPLKKQLFSSAREKDSMSNSYHHVSARHSWFVCWYPEPPTQKPPQQLSSYWYQHLVLPGFLLQRNDQFQFHLDWFVFNLFLKAALIVWGWWCYPSFCLQAITQFSCWDQPPTSRTSVGPVRPKIPFSLEH